MKIPSFFSFSLVVSVGALLLSLLRMDAATIYEEDFTDPVKLGNSGASAELGNGGSYEKGTWVFSSGNSGVDTAATGDGSGSSPQNKIASTDEARPQVAVGTNARAIAVILDGNQFVDGIEYTVSFEVIGYEGGADTGRYWLAFIRGYDGSNGVAIDGTQNGWGSGAGTPKPFTASGGGNAVIQYVEDSSSNGVLIDGENVAGQSTVSFTFTHDGVSDVAFAVGTYNNVFAFDTFSITDPNDGNILPSVTVNGGMSQYLEIDEDSTQTVAISASDPDGSISEVRAFVGGQEAGTIAPQGDGSYLLSDAFVGVTPGAYDFEVYAYDNLGGSASVTVPFYIVPADGELTGQHPYLLDEANIKEYLRYIPPGYNDDPDKKWPLLLWLHGAGARGTEATGLLTKGGPPSRIKNNDVPQLSEFIVISPRVVTSWQTGNAQNEIDALVDAHTARFRVDTDRLIITGQSMGGRGTYENIAANPLKYAAVVPLCGRTDTIIDRVGDLAHLPFWIFHDAGDPTISIDFSDDFVADLAEVNAPNYTYTRLVDSQPNAHAIWWDVYQRPELYDWMLGWSLDTDGDGASAREEYEAGTSATDSQSVFRILTADKTENGFGLSWSSVPGRTYTIYQSESLSGGWQEMPGQIDIAADPSMTNTILLPNETPDKMFYRVETTR